MEITGTDRLKSTFGRLLFAAYTRITDDHTLALLISQAAFDTFD